MVFKWSRVSFESCWKWCRHRDASRILISSQCVANDIFFKLLNNGSLSHSQMIISSSSQYFSYIVKPVFSSTTLSSHPVLRGCPVLTLPLSDHISNSRNCLTHKLYNLSSENLVWDRLSISKLIFSFFLMTCLVDKKIGLLIMSFWVDFGCCFFILSRVKKIFIVQEICRLL